MPRGGHNAKTVSEHKKTGTIVPSRHNNRLENSAEALKDIPEPPEYIPEKHKKKWKQVCALVIKLGILNESDFDLIDQYVKHYFISQEAYKDIVENGQQVKNNAGIRENPALRTMRESDKVCRDLAERFGFSPLARMKIKVAPKQENKPTILNLIKGGSVKTG